MSSQYTREHLKISAAKILQTLGWHSSNSTPLEIITDILHNYIFQLSKVASEYANEFGFTEPNLDHLGLAFREMGISLPELEEFVKYVNFGTPATQVCKYPVPKEDQLNFLKPGSKEVVTRPVHIHEHLPPMNPILEGAIIEKETMPPIPEKVDEVPENPSVFKKPPDVPHGEFKRIKREDEGSRPTREISSVMMTTSGFLSPAREGRLPEAKTPIPPPAEIPPQPPQPIINSLSEHNMGVLPMKKLPRPMKRVERKKDRIGKELFKNHEDKVRKNPKEPFKVKHMKKIANDLSLMPNFPQFLNMGKLPLVPPLSNQKINPVKFNNKTLQAARMKTEKFNTTITPLPLKSMNNRSQLSVDKLHTIPDRKKANILKKISNMKEKIEEKVIIKKEEKEDPSSPPDLIIDEPEDIIPKLKQFRSDITIEPINPTTRPDVSIKSEPMYFDESPPGTPSTPKTPEMMATPPSVIKEKKKRKPKVPKMAKTDPQPTNYATFNETEALVDRPKTPKAEIDVSTRRQSPVPQAMPEFPFGNINPYQFGRPNLNFLANFGGPGLIPPPLGNPLNPLFPTHFPLLNLSDFGQNPYLPQNLPTPNHLVPKVEEMPSSSSSAPEPVSLPPPRTPEPVTSSIKPDKIDKKSKEHKKEKKDKLKKKLKKEKLKAEKKEEKKKIKKKEKKDKRKEKEIKEEPSTAVPKLTLKLKSPSPRPVTPDTTTKKLNIKPVVKKESELYDDPDVDGANLARISALVTGPPKSKNTPPPTPPQQQQPVAPAEDIIKREEIPENAVKQLTGPARPKAHPVKAKPVKPKKKHSPVQKDAEGNEVWICPACSRQDDGSPMIGCDGCDAWYHWVCVGIQVPPDENENWYCRHCLLKKDEDLQSDKKKKRKRKDKKDHQ
ncbi:transcription initiation factor TFIID subunit 3 isoform X2 [Coccinella septempunctata]|uniref:transcription initiation factor TFIID subunit 3 isoform X2 n=1 Tax=Coccinella septempunctata TaxID=41139 RepID=UPI001D06B86A|nr:transcription initiation factor TFIID subunit 3 isoform X2 [Coccinella septempunctata]